MSKLGVMSNFYDVKTVARVLRLTPRAVVHRIQAGAIAATKIGAGRTSAYVVTAGELARLVREAEGADKP